jgi:predicted nucleic acid-binding protein
VRVVADTGPPHYLVLIGQIDILPRMFDSVAIPDKVRYELDRPTTPASVRTWIAFPPAWLSIIAEAQADDDAALAALDDGERAAIVLATALRADLILMDDRLGVATARRRGFAVTGTLGLLDRGARHGLVDLIAAFAALKATNFHTRQELLDTLLAEHSKDRRT